MSRREATLFSAVCICLLAAGCGKDRKNVSGPSAAVAPRPPTSDSSSAVSAQGDKVTICHKQKETLSISTSAWPAHQAHGDTQGACTVASAAAAVDKPVSVSDALGAAGFVMLGLAFGLSVVVLRGEHEPRGGPRH